MNPTSESALVCWPLILTNAVLFGSAVFVMVESADSAAVADAVAPWWPWAAAVNLIISPLALLVAIAEMAGEPVAQVLQLVPEAMRQTHVGRLWLWRLPASALLFGAALAPIRSRVKAWAVCLLAAAALLFQSLESHAIDRGTLAVFVYFVHESAAGLWIGALGAFLLVGMSGSSARRWLPAAAREVSRLAGWSVAALAVTGVYTAFGSIGWSWDHLFYALYGRTLLWKLGTASPLVLLGAYNRYRLIPDVSEPSTQVALLRTVAVECVLLAGVLAWSAMLANTPPPH